MLRLWNVTLTCLLLFAAYVSVIAYGYDGYCYGFSDGKWPCSLAEHFEANHAWFGFLVVLYFPELLIVGALIYFVNDVIYQAVVHRRMQRWLDEASDEPAESETTQRPPN